MQSVTASQTTAMGSVHYLKVTYIYIPAQENSETEFAVSFT